MKVFELLQEQLKGLEVDETKIDELVELTKKELPKEWIPKDKFNEKLQELETVNQKLEETNTTIEELKASTENVEELKSKLNEVNSEYEQFKSEADKRVERIRKESLFKDSLVQSNADPELLDLLMLESKEKIDDMKLNEKGDDIVGKEEYINSLKERRSKAFLKNNVVTPNPENGDGANVDDIKLKSVRKAMGLE